MTILEKIAKIKENTQKAYNAGYAKGKKDALTDTLTFTSGETLTFGKGQTWEEFVNSSYNTDNAFRYFDGNIYHALGVVTNFDTGERVQSTELIDKNTNYYFAGN